eukprot:1341345-Rhodomonas_salina.3
MSQNETLATVLVQAFRQQDDGLPALIQDVLDSDIDGLLDELKVRASYDDPDEVVALARLLLSQQRTREKAALHCIRLIQEQTIKDRAAFRCLPDLRAAFVDSFAERGDIQKSSASGLLQNTSDIILSFLKSGSDGLDESSQSGFSQALELLPTVLECLSTEAFFLRRKTPKKTKDSAPLWTADGVISHIVDSSWPSQMVLPLLSVLIDADLTQQQQEQACAKVASALTQVPEAHLNGLVQCALSAAGKFEAACWMNTVRRLLNAAPPNTLRDIFCIIEISLQNGSTQLELLLEVFAANAGGENAITASDVTLLLLVAQNDLCRFTVMETVTSALVQMCQPFRNIKAEERQRAAERLLSDVCQRSEAVWQCSLLLELGSALMQRQRAGGEALGSHLLAELFHWLPHCRPELLHSAFNALVEQSQPQHTQTLFLTLLKRIAATHLLALRDLVQALGHGIALLWLAPISVARPALLAFIPVCKHSRALTDKLLVMFRKEMYGADTARAALAVFGQCHLLLAGVFEEEQEQSDAIVALKPVLSAALPVRGQLHAGLSALLRRPHLLHVGASQMLQQMLMVRVQAYVRPASELERERAEPTQDVSMHRDLSASAARFELRVLRCFEHHSFNAASTLRAKESLTGLLQCLAAVADRDEGAADIMTSLSAQLTDPAAVLDMLKGDGRGEDAGECEGSKVPVGERAALILPLFELCIVSAAQTPPPAWVVPPALQGRGKGAKAGGQGESVQALWLHIFSTVSALFPLSNGHAAEHGEHVASHVTPEDALVTLERLASCYGLQRAGGGGGG